MGKCKHHEVCDLESPQIPDGGLCILHSNDPNKSGGEFNTALKAQIGRSNDFSFMVFPVPVRGGDVFAGNAWSQSAKFDHVTFFESAYFVDFSFRGGATFNGAAFHAKADFHRARFASAVDFCAARFEQDADFETCTFGDNENPNMATRFESARFKREAKFSDSKFIGRTFFSNAAFVGTADFSNVECAAEMVFVDTAFHAKASFERAAFRKPTAFVGSPTERVFLDVAKFEAVTVTEPGGLRFDGVRLEQAFFHDSDVKNIEFIGVKWAVAGIKRLASTGLVYQLLPARRVERLLPGRQAVYDEIASGTERPPWARLERLYNHLRKNYEERRDFGTAGDFHAGELEMRLRNPDTPVATRVVLAAYKLASRFDQSWFQPLLLFILLLLFVSGITVLSGLNTDEASHSGALVPSVMSTLGSAMLSTLESSLRLSVTDTGASGVGRLCRIMVVIIGPVLLGLFALAVRQRVKR